MSRGERWWHAFQGDCECGTSVTLLAGDPTTQSYDREGLQWSVAGYRFRAMVPVVPPRLRPTRALTTYHVLWEAEWGKAPAPPGDPALLKHVGGDLWAVLAMWDLTPLERAVLGQRLV